MTAFARLRKWISDHLIEVFGIGFLVFLLIADLVFGWLNAHYQFSWQIVAQDFYANVATELAGILITVVIIGWLVNRRQEQQLKEQLVRDLEVGSDKESKAFSRRALRELKARDWLYNGKLRNSIIVNADLSGEDLSGSDLVGVSLMDANLKGTNMNRTNLADANLKGANLENANLLKSNLTNTRLGYAKLTGASLKDANVIDGSIYPGATLTGARFNNATEWPEGFDPKAAGAINVDEEDAGPGS